MDLRDFLRLIRRSWAAILVTVGIFVIVSAAYTFVQKPSYSATATAYVSVSANSSVTDLSQGADFVTQAVKTYATVATSAYVLRDVISDLRLHTTVGQLKDQVTAEAPVDATLLTITATAASPADSAAIANSVTTQLSKAVDQLTPSSRNNASIVTVSQIDPATAPTRASSPNVPLNLGIALILGLAVGIALAVLRQRLDTRVRDRDEMRAIVDAPVLGEILDDPRAARRPLVTADGDDSRAAEAYRTLRTNLEFLDYDRRSRSMVVTSSVPGEGKSVSVANLAVVMAEAGLSVVLIDADLRRPQVGTYFGLEDKVGLTDVLIGTLDVEQAMQRWHGPTGPLVLPAGRIPPNPSELLQSDAMRLLIEDLERKHDVVLIDTPPVLPVSDAAILTRRTSGALLIAASGRTRKADLRRAVLNLRQVDGRVLGLVLTMVPVRRGAGYGYERIVQPAIPRETATSDKAAPPSSRART